MIKKKEKESPEINSASMADIVFLLLIFFLVTTTIDTDKGISLALPPKGETMEVNKKNLANILINASGEVMLDEERVPIPQISNKAREMLQQNDKLAFSVKTLRATKYDVYIDVVDQLKRAGATRISIAEPD